MLPGLSGWQTERPGRWVCVLEEILPLICCPVSREPLRLATATELAALAGQEPAGCWLVSEKGARAYPVRGGIPQLVPESAIALPDAPSPTTDH